MKFANPDMLWLLAILVPLLVFFLWWSRNKRRRLIAQFVQSRLLASLTVGVSARRQLIKSSLLVGVVALLMVSLARPYWRSDWQDAKQQGLDIVVAVDTSRSMLAPDISPDRITRTKLAVRDLMLKSRTDRLALVPFAGTAFIQCPLTVDQEAFQQNINILDVDIIPEGGTDLGAAIDTAVTAFNEGESAFRVIVLFTDGEDHNDRALKAAQAAARDGIRIFTVGVGTAAGDLLSYKDARGNTIYLRDPNGNVIKSHLNEPLLKKIAEATGGFYVSLGTPNAIDLLYERGLAPLPRAELAAAKIRRPIDRFQWPLGFAILLLVFELFISERRRFSRDDVKAAAPAPYWQAGLVLLLAGSTAMGSPRTARQAYDKGEFATALEQYRQLLKNHADDPRLSYNAGAAAYQAGNFDEAADMFSDAQKTSDLKLAQEACYNRGNALYRQGEALERTDVDGTISHWQDALKEYENALNLNTKDGMARHNKAFVEEKLMALKKKRNQEGQNKQKGKQQQKDRQKGGQGEGAPNQGNKPNDGQPQGPPNQNQQNGDDGDQKQPPPKNGGQGQQQQQQGSGQDQQKPSSNDPNQQMAAYGQMTAEQARQLLESQRGEERALLFLPQNRTNHLRDPLKNW